MPVPSALMLKLTETFHCVDKLPTTVALFLIYISEVMELGPVP